jgi:aminoglycoside phosphotransferase (APT) family kinase protein
VYESVLPHVPVTSPRFHGACDEPDGTAWLFIEHAGEVRFDPDDRVHRELAARWLGQMHGATAAMAGGAALPPAGQERYLGHLRSARATILENLGNQAISADDLAVLEVIVGQCDTLEALWPGLEQVCASYPATLVHADFRPKNLCLRLADGELALSPIDWEKAGWGVPAADLALLLRRGPASHVAAPAYAETIRGHLPQLDLDAIQRLASVGHVFQSLAGVHWSCAELRFESARSLVRPIGSMRIYAARIQETLDSAGEWR